MPIYEYQCHACGHKLEAFQKLSEAPLEVCPQCKESKLGKLVSAAGFQLKGGGWYATDYSGKRQSQEQMSSTDTAKVPSTDTKADKAASSGATADKAASSDATENV